MWSYTATGMLRTALHPTTLEALKGKLRILRKSGWVEDMGRPHMHASDSQPPPSSRTENEHRSTIEALESSKAAQQEEIQRTKEENQQLRARLQQHQKVRARAHALRVRRRLSCWWLEIWVI